MAQCLSDPSAETSTERRVRLSAAIRDLEAVAADELPASPELLLEIVALLRAVEGLECAA